jgi:hypothetical protein
MRIMTPLFIKRGWGRFFRMPVKSPCIPLLKGGLAKEIYIV